MEKEDTAKQKMDANRSRVKLLFLCFEWNPIGFNITNPWQNILLLLLKYQENLPTEIYQENVTIDPFHWLHKIKGPPYYEVGYLTKGIRSNR